MNLKTTFQNLLKKAEQYHLDLFGLDVLHSSLF
jgi:hypothetical protein